MKRLVHKVDNVDETVGAQDWKVLAGLAATYEEEAGANGVVAVLWALPHLCGQHKGQKLPGSRAYRDGYL